MLISTGSELGGAPFDPKAPFLASNLGRSLVQSVAYRLVDSGVLDPTATIEAWVPRMPGAKTVTVQMLLDGTTGWGDFKTAINDNVLPDLSRVWTLGEVVDVAARLGTTGGTGREIDTTVLGYILEKATGSSIADLVRKHVTVPHGLNRTTIDVARIDPETLDVRRVHRRYTRLAPRRWRVETEDGDAAVEFEVDSYGVVTYVPDQWRRVTPSPAGA